MKDVQWGVVFPDLKIHFFRTDRDVVTEVFTSFYSETNAFLKAVFPVSDRHYALPIIQRRRYLHLPK